MITHGEAVRLRDERLVRAVKSAEEASGFRIAIRYSEQGRHLVQVSLVPRRHLWICDLDNEGHALQLWDHDRRGLRPNEGEASPVNGGAISGHAAE